MEKREDRRLIIPFCYIAGKLSTGDSEIYHEVLSFNKSLTVVITFTGNTKYFDRVTLNFNSVFVVKRKRLLKYTFYRTNVRSGQCL